ncbi:MAG: UPF0175 family protein [Acidobacteria bacterium]|nr:UPF0175 family protein [Acidobacteriota bacterium]
MSLISVELPDADVLSALEQFRYDRISLGRGAELSGTSVEAFMEFAAGHEVPLHYGEEELEEDRRSLQNLLNL